jgi:hypothetical protein
MVSITDPEDDLQQLGTQWQTTLATLHARIACRFRRAEARARVRHYLEGLIAPVERKNGWQLAEQLGEAGPQGAQRLLNAADWDAEAVRDDLRAFIVEELGDASGVLIIDETGFLKKGTKSAGVARQYSGTAGRRENQQVGVFLAYATPQGCAFIDRALYLPETWTDDADRRAEAGIPSDVAFATKGTLAQAMLVRAVAAGVPVAWVVGDTVYGHDELRHWLEEQGRNYVLAVPATHGIWTAGEQVAVATLADHLPEAAWTRLSAGDGSQGPRWYDWACLALPYPAAAGKAHWLLVRRGIGEPRSGPTTGSTGRRPRRCRSWCGWPAAVGRSRWASSKRRGWWGSTSTRCGSGRRGTAISPSRCSPTPRSWSPAVARRGKRGIVGR